MLKKILPKTISAILVLACCLSYQDTVAMDVENEIVNFKDRDKVYQKFYAVHASPILLKNCTAIAGVLSDLQIIPKGVTIQKRKTLHHCIGGVIPHQALSTTIYNADGTREVIDRTADSFEKTRHYAYLDPLKNLKGEIIGGSMIDLFTAGNHTYGPDSIVIIPESDVEKFNSQNTEFKGRLLTYNPTSMTLVDIIEETLIQQNSWRCLFSFTNSPGSTKNKEVHYTFVPGGKSDRDLEIFFAEEFSYVGGHNPSPCGKLEELLTYFSYPFTHAFLNNKDSCWRLAVPSSYIPVIKALVLKKLEQILSYQLRQDVLEDLKNWKEDILSFIHLHEFDKELRENEEKSLFYGSAEIWSTILEHRSDGQKLEELSRTIPKTPSYILKIIEDKGFNWTWSPGIVTDLESYIELTEAYTNAGLYQKAIDSYQALFANPTYQPSYWDLWELAKIYEKANDYLEAGNTYRKGIDLIKSSGDSVLSFRYKHAAKAYCTGGNFQRGAGYMDKCFAKDPKPNIYLMFDKLTIDLLSQRYDIDEAVLNNCLEFRSSHSLAFMRVLSFIYILKRDFEKADDIIQSIDEYYQRNPQDELKDSAAFLLAFLRKTPDLLGRAESYEEKPHGYDDWGTPFYVAMKYHVLQKANHPGAEAVLSEQGLNLPFTKGCLALIEDIQKVLDSRENRSLSLSE